LSVRVFAGNLSYEVTESDLRELFSQVGTVTQIRIPLDRESGRPRGFAFVDLADGAQADEAIRLLHQKVFKGRPLAVNAAVAREEGAGPSRGPGGGGPPRGGGGGPSARAQQGPPPSGERVRSFGADAVPRSRRKSESWASKGPKGPLKEVGAAGSYRGALDLDDDDDDAADEKPFWEVAQPTDPEDQAT
jgi:RNA recognition motif-containing protein